MGRETGSLGAGRHMGLENLRMMGTLRSSAEGVGNCFYIAIWQVQTSWSTEEKGGTLTHSITEFLLFIPCLVLVLGPSLASLQVLFHIRAFPHAVLLSEMPFMPPLPPNCQLLAQVSTATFSMNLSLILHNVRNVHRLLHFTLAVLKG